ncbi:MAG TPA: glycosyl hydrolase [Acidimicrobiales bacterium]|nr:glycosyl hydrolase [Acidimicrobiales bacterium]
MIGEDLRRGRAPARARHRTPVAAGLLVLAVGVLALGPYAGGDVVHADDEGDALPSVHAGGVPLGVYVGPGDPRSVADFATATGTRPSLASDYLPGGDGWAGMVMRAPLARFLAPWDGSRYRLVLGVPLVPTARGRAVGTLAAGAAGRYDAEFTTLAESLAFYGQGDAIVRLGWEFNAPWYPWGVANTAGAADYAAYFRHVVTAMRSVPGTSFRFVWNATPGPSPFDLAAAYPGDGYVDFVGLDLYDQIWGMPQDPNLVWSHFLTEANGLRWLSSFADAHHKAAVIPEWGVTIRSDGHGLGDDPLFVARMAGWVTTHDVAFTSYFGFDAPDGRHDILDGAFPNSLTAFEHSFATAHAVAVAGPGPGPGPGEADVNPTRASR